MLTSSSHHLAMLLAIALGNGCIHTLLGPDHYIPFIAMSKARQWTSHRTAWITAACGMAHVFSASLLGFVGIAVGEKLLEGLAGWLLLAFGLTYLIWGLRRALKPKIRSQKLSKKMDITAWVLFIIFVLGPCEPLIPLQMFAATTGSSFEVMLTLIVFAIATISTMVTVVIASVFGMSFIKKPILERYGHAIAGLSIVASGVGVVWLGL